MSIERDWTTASGLREVVRVHEILGYRCGYVAVPETHPLFGKHYDEVAADVHGGLTFSKVGDGRYPAPGRSLWWFGYDCAHLGDLVPNVATEFKDGVERTLDYCVGECERLAEQLQLTAAGDINAGHAAAVSAISAPRAPEGE